MNIVDDYKLTVEEVASLLNRKPETILRLIKKKRILAEKRRVPRNDKFKFSNKFFISEKSLEKYIDFWGLTTSKPKVIKNHSKINKINIKYIDKIKRIHSIVNELGGVDSFKKTFKLYCVYRELFDKKSVSVGKVLRKDR